MSGVKCVRDVIARGEEVYLIKALCGFKAAKRLCVHRPVGLPC